MGNFEPGKYQATIQDIFHDISMADLSYRGKIILVRSYAEIIVRRLLDMRDNKHLELGSEQTRNALDAMGFTEPFFREALDNIRKTSNGVYHTQKPMPVKEDHWIGIFEALQKLFAYLFYRHFKNYPFGSNPQVMTSFSILPPAIRHIALEALYSEDNTNTAIVEKLLLAKLKTFDYNTAKQWLATEREHLQSLSVNPLVFNGAVLIPQSNWFVVCSDKLEVMKNRKPLYSNFAEAKEYYIEHGGIEGDTEEIREFNDLMVFVYIGF